MEDDGRANAGGVFWTFYAPLVWRRGDVLLFMSRVKRPSSGTQYPNALLYIGVRRVSTDTTNLVSCCPTLTGYSLGVIVR